MNPIVGLAVVALAGLAPAPEEPFVDAVVARAASALVAAAEPSEPRVPGPSYPVVRVLGDEPLEIREAPAGAVIGELASRTEFGSERNLWVARESAGWLGVPVPELPNGRLAWIADDPERLERRQTPFAIHVDLSAQLVELRYGKRVLDRFGVSVGAPGSPTPPGAYAVTDALAGEGTGPYYGCCVLALTGHQPNLPPDWLGGDRIAIHGTPGTVGGATSAGCLRASDPDMVSLFARVPLGAPVFIGS